MSTKYPSIDFGLIAKAALGNARRLLEDWLPGGEWNGSEYKPLNPTRDDRSRGSFVINAATGKWIDNATSDSGGDLISLYAYIRFMQPKYAAIAVACMAGVDVNSLADLSNTNLKVIDNPEADKYQKKSPWIQVIPVPSDAPEPPVAHYVRGRPQTAFTYRNRDGLINGYVYRFIKSDGGKETLPLCFCKNADDGRLDWRWMGFAEPRHLYNLHHLKNYPDLPVLLVEGEKCADAATQSLGDGYVVLTWPGGTKAVHKVDFRPLVGRKIIAWADCDAQRRKPTPQEKELGADLKTLPILGEPDQPGMRAMRQIHKILLDLDPSIDFRFVDIPKPGDKPSGWDVADAIDEMEFGDLLEFIGKLRDPDTKKQRSPEGSKFDGLLMRNGQVRECLANVYDILKRDPRWSGVLGFNEFSYVIAKLKPPPFDGGSVGEWDVQDDVHASMWLTREYEFAPTPNQVAEAVEALARSNGFHPVRDYLDGIEWDGIKRLDEWIFDYVGAPKTSYTMRVARWFLIGMIARVMEPGVKFDCCLVLEGAQGRRKSSMLRILAGEWFGDTDLDLHNKDSMGSIRGKWLYEFAELGALARTEATKQKSFLSRQVDEYRPPYARRDICSPRQLVFGGTTNDWAWNKDSTGGRRFWPIECQYDIDCDGLLRVRDQLFAEAYVMYRNGARFWPTSEEQRKIFDPEQIKRHQQDGYVDYLAGFIKDRDNEFSIADAADHLKIDPARFSRDIQTRIGQALAALGCKKVERKKRDVRTWYQPPVTPGGTGDTTDSSEDDDGIPF
jgi:predicted P-loop ATPase